MARDSDEDTLLRRLIFEATVAPLNNAYRRTFLRAASTITYLYVKSRRASRPAPLDERAEAIAFGFFRNELSALDAAIGLHPNWRKRAVSLRELTGLDWRRIFAPAPRLLPGFLWRIGRLGGWSAVRDFAYPFVGYLLFEHFRGVFGSLRERPAIVTTNLIHPLSLGIHLAALRAGLPTIFWEHAMTPRMLAKDLGYSAYHVNCPHTRLSFLSAGVPESQVHLIEASADLVPVPLGDPGAVRRVGVAVNDLDELRHVEATLVMLAKLERTAVLRVHDSDKRFPEFERMARRHGVSLSSAAHTRIATFMDEVDVVIAGNSNVVLDCLRARKRVIYFWPGAPGQFDYYGVVGATKCEHASDLAQLSEKFSRGS